MQLKTVYIPYMKTMMINFEEIDPVDWDVINC